MDNATISTTIPTVNTKEKKVSGIADRALEKAAGLSAANVEITWLRNSQGKALQTTATIDGHSITADDNTRLIAALFTEIWELRNTIAEMHG